MASHKLFVVVRQSSEGQRFDLYREARPEKLLPKNKGLTRITIDRDLTYEGIGVALASFAPEGEPVSVEIQKVVDVHNYHEWNCA